jgi:hypothetical protein
MAKKTERKLPPPSIGKGTPVKWLHYVGVISGDHLDPGGMRDHFLVTFFIPRDSGIVTLAVGPVLLQSYIKANELIPVRFEELDDTLGRPEMFLLGARVERIAQAE